MAGQALRRPTIPAWLVTVLTGVISGVLGGLASPVVSDFMCSQYNLCNHDIKITAQTPELGRTNLEWSEDARCSRKTRPKDVVYGNIFPFHIEAEGYRGRDLFVASSYQYTDIGHNRVDNPFPNERQRILRFQPAALRDARDCTIWMQDPDGVGLPGIRIGVRLEVYDGPPGKNRAPITSVQPELSWEPIKLFIDRRPVTPQKMYQAPERWFLAPSTSSVVLIGDVAWIPLDSFAKIMAWKVVSSNNGKAVVSTKGGQQRIKTEMRATWVADKPIGFVRLGDLCKQSTGWYFIWRPNSREIRIGHWDKACDKVAASQATGL